MNEPRTLGAADLRVGLTASFERQVAVEDIEQFASLSGDYNPLHVDSAYASGTNYGAPIAHGAFQVALASTMAGMYLPGRNVVVGAFHSRFPAPLFIPAHIRVQGEIAGWTPATNTGTLRVTVLDTRRSTTTAEILVTFGLHETRARSPEKVVAAGLAQNDHPLVVITGAGGAVGLELVSALAAGYRIVALGRSGLPVALSALPGLTPAICDLEAPMWEEVLDEAVGDAPVYAVIHAAWPGMPNGGLLEADPAAIARQVQFGSLVTVRLARWLARHTRNEGRLLVLGTTAATVQPMLNQSAYSLGKATLEHTVRLLAPELGRKGITVNGVLPSFMPIGMNAAVLSKAILSEQARVPVGRLCGPEDVTAAVKYLLSPEASFITGQFLALTGGRL